MRLPSSLLFSIAFCFNLSSSTIAQNHLLLGQVINENAQPIPAVHLYCLNDSLQQATSTNIKGAFKLVVSPPFPKTLLCSHVSYRSDTLVVQQAGTLPPIVLQKNRHAVTPIEITANTRQAGDLNYRDRAHIRPDVLNRAAGGLQDPARLTQLLPGVSMREDLSNAFVVRGNTPVGNLWLVDGIEAASPNHFADFNQSGGAIGMISTDLLDTYDFYRSAFPAEFNNASSSVINIGVRAGNPRHIAANLNVGLLGLGGSIEGPINKQKGATFLANYRYSTLSLLEKINHPALNNAQFGEISTTQYQDVLCKFAFPTKKGKLSMLGLFGKSRLLDDQLATTTYAYFQAYLMGMGSLKYVHFHNRHLQSQWMLSVDRNITEWNTEERISDKDFPIRHEKAKQLAVNAFVKLNHRINNQNNLLYGIRFKMAYQDMIARYTYYYHSQTNSWDSDDYFTRNGNRTQTSLYSFVEWHRQIRQHWFLNLGGALSYYPDVKNRVAEPRLSITYHKNKWSWNYKMGLHNKLIPATYYLNLVADTLPNTSLKPVRTIQQATTFTYSFAQHYDLKITPYFQYFFNVPVKNDSSSLDSYANNVRRLPDGPYVNEGESVSYGIELLFSKQLANHWHFSNALSLFNAKFAPLDGKYRHTASNSNFIWSLNAGKNFVLGKRKKNLLQIDGQFFWAGGQRYQEIIIETNANGREIDRYLLDEYNKKAKAYMRLNLKITYLNQKRKLFSWKLYAEVLNVLNRDNEFVERYNTRRQEYDIYRQQGITPNIGFSCQFHGKE